MRTFAEGQSNECADRQLDKNIVNAGDVVRCRNVVNTDATGGDGEIVQCGDKFRHRLGVGGWNSIGTRLFDRSGGEAWLSQSGDAARDLPLRSDFISGGGEDGVGVALLVEFLCDFSDASKTADIGSFIGRGLCRRGGRF